MNIKEIRQKYPQYDDLSDVQLAQALHKKHYSDMPFEDFASRIGMSAAKRGAEATVDEMGWGDKFLTSVGRGFDKTIAGVEQLNAMRQIMPGVGPTAPRFGRPDPNKGFETLREVERDQKLKDESFSALEERNPVTSFVGEAVGGIASTPLPGGSAAKPFVQRVAQGALSNALASAVQYAPDNKTRLQNTLVGSAFGAGGETLGAGIGRMADKLSNAKAGNFASDSVQEVMEAGTREGVPVTVPDVSSNALLKKADVAMEPLGSFGTAGKRLQQAEKAKQAAQKWMNDLDPEAEFGSFNDSIQESLKRQKNNLKEVAKQKYNRVVELLDDQGSVDLINTRAKIDELISAETARGSLADEALITELQKYKDAPDFSFSDVRNLASELGEQIRNGQKGQNAALSTRETSVLQQIKSTLDSDMERFAKEVGGEAEGAWREANTFYREKIAIPYRETRLKQLIKNDESEAAFKFLTQGGGSESRANRMFGALDDKGKQAVMYGLFKNAHDKAIDATRPGQPFSPARFARYLEDQQINLDKFASPEYKKQLDGLVKLMRHIERAGQVAENPPTGQRLIPYLAAGGFAVDPKMMTGAIASGTGFKLLMQQPNMVKLMMAASTATPGSQKFNNIYSLFSAQVQRSLALTSATERSQQNRYKKSNQYQDQ